MVAFKLMSKLTPKTCSSVFFVSKLVVWHWLWYLVDYILANKHVVWVHKMCNTSINIINIAERCIYMHYLKHCCEGFFGGAVV